MSNRTSAFIVLAVILVLGISAIVFGPPLLRAATLGVAAALVIELLKPQPSKRTPASLLQQAYFDALHVISRIVERESIYSPEESSPGRSERLVIADLHQRGLINADTAGETLVALRLNRHSKSRRTTDRAQADEILKTFENVLGAILLVISDEQSKGNWLDHRANRYLD